MSDGSTGPRFIPRFIGPLIQQTLADTPVTVVQGARQVGKSTLVREVVAGSGATFVTLDDPAAQQAALADPESFVRQADGLLAIDEVQRAPALIRAIKRAVDDDRRPGRFLITGSANLLELPGAQDSLAGRAETIPLYGLSKGEMEGSREDFIDLVLAGDSHTLRGRPATLNRHEYLEIICAGSYPEPLQRTGQRRNAWFDNYLRRIVSRDARDVSRLIHLDRLPILIKALAANNAGELVLTRLAVASGLPETSLRSYIALLERLYLVHRLPPWGNNLTSRAIGRPKVALLDSGLAARLGHLSPKAMGPGASDGAAGALFEAYATGELRRQTGWATSDVELFHFRHRDGYEVDVVIEDGHHNVAGIEIKATASPGKRHFAGLEFLREKIGKRFTLGVLLYSGKTPLPFGDRIWALPYQTLWSANGDA
jgi:uncharacterized protein